MNKREENKKSSGVHWCCYYYFDMYIQQWSKYTVEAQFIFFFFLLFGFWNNIEYIIAK